MVKLSILMPVYNEEDTLAEIVELIDKVELSKVKVDKELIIVDDGSKDGTFSIVNKLKKKYSYIKFIKHKKNLGKGAALSTAIENATGDIFIIQDADLEYNPQDYLKCIMPILDNRADVVYGSRFSGKNNSVKYKVHWLAVRFLDFMVLALYFNRIGDVYTCYKTFRADCIAGLDIAGDRFDWEIVLTAKLLKRGFKICGVPISYYPRSFSEGKKINWRDGVQAAWALIKYRFVD